MADLTYNPSTDSPDPDKVIPRESATERIASSKSASDTSTSATSSNMASSAEKVLESPDAPSFSVGVGLDPQKVSEILTRAFYEKENKAKELSKLPEYTQITPTMGAKFGDIPKDSIDEMVSILAPAMVEIIKSIKITLVASTQIPIGGIIVDPTSHATLVPVNISITASTTDATNKIQVS